MRTPLRNLSLLATAVVIGLCTASSASAANLVPNPGFEADCPPAPCNWSPTSFATVSRVTTNPHSDFASMQLTLTMAGGFGAESTCVNTTASGVTTVSFYYRTTDSRVTSISFGGTWYVGANCTGASSSAGNALSATANGQWNPMSFAVSIPAGRNSVRFLLAHNCSPCTGGVAVFYDDVVFDPNPPTAVSLMTLAAQHSRAGVVARWRTSSEVETLGFNLYRQHPGRLVKLNRALIPSVFGGTASGHAYSWIDRRAPREATKYRLQAVSLSGAKSWVGSATVGR